MLDVSFLFKVKSRFFQADINSGFLLRFFFPRQRRITEGRERGNVATRCLMVIRLSISSISSRVCYILETTFHPFFPSCFVILYFILQASESFEQRFKGASNIVLLI